MSPRPPAEPAGATAGYSRERIGYAVLLLVTCIGVYLCWLLAKPFLTAITWALAWAVVGHPLHRYLLRFLKSNLSSAGWKLDQSIDSGDPGSVGRQSDRQSSLSCSARRQTALLCARDHDVDLRRTPCVWDCGRGAWPVDSFGHHGAAGSLAGSDTAGTAGSVRFEALRRSQ